MLVFSHYITLFNKGSLPRNSVCWGMIAFLVGSPEASSWSLWELGCCTKCTFSLIEQGLSYVPVSYVNNNNNNSNATKIMSLADAIFADERVCQLPCFTDFFRQNEKAKDNFDFPNKASKTAN